MSLYSARVAQDNPVLYFENNASGVNNTGSRTPTITTGSLNTFSSTGGVSNSAYMTVGSNTGSAYGFEYSDSTATFDDRTFSITGWFKVASGDISSSINWLFHTGTSGNGIALQNQTLFALFNGVQVDLGTTITNDVWHHFAVTMDTTNLKLYYDGSLVDTATSPASLSMDSQVKYWMRQTTGGTTRNGAKGKFDELAVFNTTLSSTTISEHNGAGFGILIEPTPVTASALSVQPTLILDSTHSASPATASALAGNAGVSNFNTPSMLRNYLASLSLEQWFEFDSNIIQNSGSGGTYQATAFGRIGTVKAQIGNGPVGGNSLELGATSVLGSMVSNSSASPMLYTTEMSDGNFAYGIWFKFPTTLGTNNKSIVTWNGSSGAATSIEIRNKKAYFSLSTSSNAYTYTGTADMNDNAWHLAVIRYNHSINTYYYYLDGSQVATGTTTGNRATPTQWVLADSGTTGDTYRFNVADFFVNGYSAIDGTVISNIWAAGTVPVQAGAGMVQPIVRFNNAYNDYSETLSPTASFRFNASGAPVNYGTEPDKWGMDIYGTNYSTGHATKNNFAYRVTNKDTGFAGGYQMSSGQFSDNQLSMSVYGKFGTVSGSDNQIIGLMGSFSTANIWINGAASGPQVIFGAPGGGANWRIINSNDTSLFGGYHLYTATRNGSTGKFYVDGKLIGTSTTLQGTFSDTNSYTIGGYETAYLGASAATVDKYIDEALIFDYTLSDKQVFELWQSLAIDGPGAVNATFVNPAYQAGYGPTISANVMIATAEEGAVFPFITPLTGQALFQNPNYEATDTVNITSDVFTASALFEDVTFNIGEYNGAQHMNASAEFPEAEVLIPGFWNANPFIANANIVQPTISTTLGALIKPQSLNATAFFALPPAYYLITDDKWYQRLLDVDYQSAAFGGKLTFFNTSDNIYLSGSYDGWTAQSNRNPLNAYYGYNLYDSPLPVASAGYFDPTNRKALNLKNIALTYADRETYTQGWTMEAMIQTTKKNQFITAGYYLGDTSSSVSRNKRTAFRLKDGKIALTKVKDSTLGQYTSADAIAWTGFKDIADGEWHHVILQYRDDDSRVQVWIDGELDIQRYGSTAYIPNQIGFNSNDVDAYSDFNISGIAINKESFVLERETYINYLAAFGITPIEATPAEASIALGTGTRGKGNRARALMLYFWPTYDSNSGYYVGSETNPFVPTGVNDSNGHDVGGNPFDYDTFYGLTTYLTDKTQTFFDWDVFPLPVKEFYSGDTYRGDKHPLLNESVIIDTGVNGTTYVDPVTDNYRYLNLLEDVYELDQYDAIFFRNYPDQSKEQDEMGLNSKTEVDEYFNIQEKTLFAEFINNLREAIDTYNISLFVTNPQLAKDLGIIADATEVPLLRNQGNFYADEYSDNRAPVVTGRVAVDGTPIDGVNIHGAGWYDTWFNDRHRLINQLEYLTDDNAFIWTDYAFYQNADALEYGGPDRLYKRYENRPYGLQIDDEFVFADSGNPRFRLPYQAVKPEDVLAGIPITALSKKIWNQNYDSYVQVDNPYKDYVTTIALPVGTNLKGKLTGGKIFVSFSENVGNSFTSENPQFNTSFVEYHQYDMASNYWVDIAYNAKIINDTQRAQYKAGTAQQPPLYDDNNAIKQYWSLSGDNIVSRVEPVTQNLKGFVGGDIPTLLQNPLRTRTRTGLTNMNAGERLRDALGRFASGGGSSSLTGGNLQTFKIITGRTYDTGTVFIPSINTRALWWLSDKVRLTGKVVGAPAMKATATIAEAVITADHPTSIVVGAMIATATINETQAKGPDRKILALPMEASATIVGLGGKNVFAGTGASATATIVSAFAVTQGPDQVVMYLHHVNPIVYLRKEIIR